MQSSNTDRGLDIADAMVQQRRLYVDAANTSVDSHAGNWWAHGYQNVAGEWLNDDINPDG